MTPITPITALPRPAASAESSSVSSAGGNAFARILQQTLAGNAADTQKANQAIEALATGKSDDLHTVSLAVAQADLSFRLILEVKNKLVEAYQEVMRMQV